jgi:hypothetical protein
MTVARKYKISLEDTPFYHVMTRCVRKAFLCGKDKDSGKSYEHRRQLISDRIKELSKVFNIMIYIPVNPSTSCLRHSNLILSNLVTFVLMP